MIKKILICFSLILILSSVSFAEDDIENIKDLLKVVKEANNILKEKPIILPSGLNYFLKNQRILAEISLNNNEKEYLTIVVKDGKIGEILNGDENPTVILQVSENTLNKIISSDDKAQAVFLAYKIGEIKIKGVKTWVKVKVYFFKKILGLAYLFAGKLNLQEQETGSFVLCKIPLDTVSASTKAIINSNPKGVCLGGLAIAGGAPMLGNDKGFPVVNPVGKYQDLVASIKNNVLECKVLCSNMNAKEIQTCYDFSLKPAPSSFKIKANPVC